jgi:Tudor domain
MDASKEWMRGVVRKIPRDPRATNAVFEVFAVDYGSIFSAPRDNIRRYYPDGVKAKFTEMQPLAIPCRLHGMTPRTGNKTKDERQREISHVLRFGEQ